MNFIKSKILRGLLLVFIVVSVVITTTLPVTAALIKKPLEGKTISILGDSISTYEDISCGDAALTTNSTISGNHLYYTNGRLGVGLNDTWWMQVMDKLGCTLLVNNSYSNSSVFNTKSAPSSQGYLDRCINLHDNTGDNAGEEPDIIIVFIGINDFSVYNEEPIGSYNEINFNSLISVSTNEVTYANPTTNCEAYAIMLHKIKTRYTNSEIYCFNFAAKRNMNETTAEAFEEYNNSINKIVKHFGCYLVDAYSNIDVNKKQGGELYYNDGIHPNKNGMDALTSVFMDSFYENSRYVSEDTRLYNVSYNLNNATVDQGQLKTVAENDSFYCSFTSSTRKPVDVKVTIDGIDHTELYVKKNEVNIPQVNGNIEITASSDELLISENYNFTISGGNLCSFKHDEFSENSTEIIFGSIDDKFITQGVFETSKTIELREDEPWSIVWRTSYLSSDETSHISFHEYSSPTKESNSFISIDSQKSILYVGEYTNGSVHSYGVDLKKYGVDINESHTYRLSNVTNENKIYLYVDGKKTDSLSDYYINGNIQTGTKKSFKIGNICLNFIGNAQNPVNNCNFEYIKIWESTVPDTHSHTLVYTCNYSLTCTEDEKTETVCDCGYAEKEIKQHAPGHKESSWLTNKTATVNQPGSAYKVCETCDQLLETKVLPQLKPAAPELYGISNKKEGIRIGWYPVDGADSYRVYRRGAGQRYWTYIATVTDTTFLDTNAKNNAYWRYTVRAGNEAGYGTYESGKYIKYVSTPHVQKTVNVTDGIQITWSKVSGAKTYRVYRNRLGYSNWTYVGSTTSTTYIDKNIKNANGVYYKYTIRAVNNYYSDFETNTSYIKRLSNPVLSSAVSQRDGIHIKWKPVLGTTGYYVYRKTSDSGWKCLGSVGGTNNTTYIDKTAKKGVTYTYTVRACYGKFLSSYNKGITCKDKY